MLEDTSALLSDLDLKTAIGNSDLFRGLEHDLLARVLGAGTKRTFARGATLTIEGTDGDRFYVIERGTVDVAVKTDEEMKVINQLGPGAVIGEVSLLCKRPRTATVTVTSEQLSALEFGEDALEQVADAVPDIRERLSKIAVPRIQQTMRMLYS